MKPTSRGVNSEFDAEFFFPDLSFFSKSSRTMTSTVPRSRSSEISGVLILRYNLIVKILPKKLSKINFAALKKEFFLWAGVGVALFAVGKWADTHVFEFFAKYVHTPELDRLIVFLTEQLIWGVLAVFVFVTGWRIWRNPDHKTKLVPAGFAVATAAIASAIFKAFFAVPRPFEISSLQPLVQAALPSFPSGHTAVAFALLIPFFRISKWIGSMWAVFALLVGLARVYENVHFPSDIAGGIFLGGVIGMIFSHPATEKTLKILWKELEFRRQSFHFLAGFLVVFAHWIGFLRLREIAVILIVGLMLSFFSARRKIPIVSDILQVFDRPRDHEFPGRGAFYFLLGVFLSILIFPVKIAYASILILSVGDSLNHLFGERAPRRINLLWNRRKSVVGLVLGIVMGTFAAQFFVPLIPAFLAASISILLETIPLRLGKFYIDDNIFVPLVAGGILMMLV